MPDDARTADAHARDAGPLVRPGRPAHASLLTLALLLALPAYLLTNESFRPIEQSFALEGRSADQVFDLAAQEPLYLEYDLVLRAPGSERPTARLTLNDVPVATLGAGRLYAAEGTRIPLPTPAIRAGENRLHLEIDGSDSATFELRARLQNYFGIAPDFPRAVVVSDEAVTQRASTRPAVQRAARFGVFFLGGLAVAWALSRVPGRRTAVASGVLLWSPVLLLWPTLVWTFTTPLHIWLSIEALLVIAFVPWIAVQGLWWVSAHRGSVARAAGVTLVTLGLLEAGLRVFNYVRPSFIFYSESYGRYRGQPGAPNFDARLNSRGFNDVERQVSRPAGTAFRVVAIGDSFAFGVVPYAANYLTLVEAELSRDAPVEVIKIGVAGTEPRDYLAMLVEEALPFGPDLVMVGFYIGNDFEARARKPHERSFVATFARFLWRARDARPADAGVAEADGNRYDDDAPGLSEDRFLEIQMNRARLYVPGAMDLPAAATRAAGYLREMRDLSRRAGADFLVVLLPDEVQIDAALQDDVARASRRARDEFDFEGPSREITRALTAENIPVLDLLPAFASEGRRIRLYKPRDTHWNLAGNRLAAATIAPQLRARRPSLVGR